jgi:alpha-tubulin suppressor-like RCC1 family protein
MIAPVGARRRNYVKHAHRTVRFVATFLALALTLAGCQTLAIDEVESFVGALGGEKSSADQSSNEQQDSADTAQTVTPTEPAPVGVEIVQVAAGRSMTFAIDAEGGLWRWGANDSDLALPPGHGERRPTRVFTDTDWAQVAVGSRHILLISAEGHLYSWGSNDNNALGLGPEFDGNPYPGAQPQLIDNRLPWVQIAAGDDSSYALLDDGTMFAWGNPADGRLGIGTVPDGQSVSWPTQVGGVWSRVSAGDRFALALTRSRQLYGFGANDQGQLGIGTQTNELRPTVILPDADWTAISAGAGYAFAIRDGQLYGWGNNEYGQVGIGTDSDPVRRATRVGTRSNWVSVSAGRGYAGPSGFSKYTPASAGIDSDGTMYLWGSNATALLGGGEEGLDRNLVAAPERVPEQDDAGWREVAVGGEHAVALHDTGNIYTWGSDRQSRSGGRPTGAVQVVPIGRIVLTP